MSSNTLCDAIKQAIAKAVARTSDRIVRLDTPRDWPVADAVRAYARDQKDRVKALVALPFRVADFKGVTATHLAGKATSWRNTKGRAFDILVIGGKDGNLMAGLDAITKVSRDDIFDCWRDAVLKSLPSENDLAKPEVQRLLRELFVQARNSRITAASLERYLDKVIQAGTVDAIQNSLPELGLVSDAQVLDDGMAARRLRRNLDLLDTLRTSDDQRLDLQLKATAKSGRSELKKAAKAALAYRQTGETASLLDTDLVSLEACLAKTPPPPSARTIGLIDLLDFHCDHAAAVTECLADLAQRWAHDEVASSIDSQLTIASESLRVSIPLRPTTVEAEEAEGEEEEEGGEEGDAVLAFQWIGLTPDDDVVAAMSDSTEPVGFCPDQTTMTGTELLGLANDKTVVLEFLEARRCVRELEPWLERDAVAVVLLWPDAVSLLQKYIDAWLALATSAIRDDVDPSFVEAVQAVETVSGPTSENPEWVVLGPLHPYRLDPLIRAGSLALRRLAEPPDIARLGAALNWTLDKSYPAYPTLHRKAETYFNSLVEPLVAFQKKHTQSLPLAREYRGLDRTIRCLESFSPPLMRSMSLLVIDPPLGGAVCRALDTAQRRIASRPLVVHHLATCNHADNLEDFDGDVHYLPKVQSLADLPVVPHVNVLLRFVTTSTSESEVTAADWRATRGTHLALQLMQSVQQLFKGEKKPQISIDPRQGNTVVRTTQDLYAKASGKKPKLATLRPLFEYGEAPVLSRMASHTDWLVFAAPGPLGLVTPKTINNTLRFVGRHGCGTYGIYVYAADDMFPVRKHFEEFFKTTPIATMQPSQMVDLLVTKAHESGNAVLFSSTAGAESQVASLVALTVAKEDCGPDDHVFILNLDDLGWTSVWLSDKLRADFVLVFVRGNGHIELRVVESKGPSAGEQIPLDAASDHGKEALQQVAATMKSLCDISTAASPDLDQDLRFTSLIEHLMAGVMAALGDLPADRRQHVIDAVNRFSRRECDDVTISGRAIITQSKVNAPRIVKSVSDNISLVWLGAPDVARAFDVPANQRLPNVDRDPQVTGLTVADVEAECLSYDAPAAEQRGFPVGAASATLAGDGDDSAGKGEQRGDISPNPLAHSTRESDPLAHVRKIATDFIHAAKVHEIPVVGATPAYIHAGPTLFAIGIRLREGTTIKSLQARAADIARDVGLGDKSHAIEVVNDSEPSTVKVMLPRSDRHFPLLPSSEQPSLLADSGEYLPVAIGQTIEGEDYRLPLESWPHLLVAGSTGSGKTTFVKALLRQFAAVGPGYLQTVVVDGKGETDYFGLLPAGMFPTPFPNVQLGSSCAVPVLQWAMEEMEERRRTVIKLTEALSREGGVKATDMFRVAIREMRMPPICPLVIVIDEFAEIMLANKRTADDFESLVQRVSQVGRSRLIHLVLATQRPDKETIRGAIKANFTTRAVFRLPTSADSIAAMGHAGAEKLLPLGDMLFEHAGSGSIRLQGYRA
jgi:hypothetical protein